MPRSAQVDLVTGLSLRAGLPFALGLSLLSLVSGARSQTPPASACADRCRSEERAAVDRCRGRARCVSDARIEVRRCALRCDTTISAAARCREECDIDSDACDAGCRFEPDERGCLRRCGSHYHISCPRECDGQGRRPDL